MQLMLETNEMATRQRSLLAELQTLRIKSSVRGVDARIGAELRRNLKCVADSLMETMRSIQVGRPRTDQRGVSPVPTLVLGDLAATPRVPMPTGLGVELEVGELSELELDETISGYVKEVDGMTVDELNEMQNESGPCQEGVGRLEDLKRDARESHVITETLAAAAKLFTQLIQQEIENQSRMAEMVAENNSLRLVFEIF